MSVRVTNSMVSRTALAGVYRAREALSDTQEQAASGLRVNRPSDDPAAASLAAQLRGDRRAIEQYQRNIGQVQSRLTTIEGAVRASEDTITRARELAVQGANGTLDAGARQLLAKEVETLYADLLASANARNAGGWVFGGSATSVPAFVASGAFASGSPPPTVSYGGDSAEIEIQIDESRRAVVTYDGRRVFQGDADGDGSPDAGREDVFAVIGELWRALDTNDPGAVSATLDRLDRGRLNFELEIARIGATTRQVETVDDRLAGARVSVTKSLSDVQDADTEDVFSRLVAQETALAAALEAASRVVPPSLLDFVG